MRGVTLFHGPGRRRLQNWRCGKLALAAGAVLFLERRGAADEIFWQAGASDWFNAANWSDQTDGLNQAPGASDDAFVENGGTAMFSGGNAAALNLTLDGGAAGLSGGSLATGNTEIVGDAATGLFTQTGGTNSAVILYLGTNAGSTGTYLLSGTGLLSVGSIEYLDQGGTSIFNQSGGTKTTVVLAVDGAAGTTGYNSLSNKGP